MRTFGRTDGRNIFSLYGSTKVENCNVLRGLVSTLVLVELVELVELVNLKTSKSSTE